jgi:hypothetical protein
MGVSIYNMNVCIVALSFYQVSCVRLNDFDFFSCLHRESRLLQLGRMTFSGSSARCDAPLFSII